MEQQNRGPVDWSPLLISPLLIDSQFVPSISSAYLIFSLSTDYNKHQSEN